MNYILRRGPLLLLTGTCLSSALIGECGRAFFIEKALGERDKFLEEFLQVGNVLAGCSALGQAVCNCFQKVEIAYMRGDNSITE